MRLTDAGLDGQIPLAHRSEPIAFGPGPDRNFYDRSYYNAHDRTGTSVITGIGYPTWG